MLGKGRHGAEASAITQQDDERENGQRVCFMLCHDGLTLAASYALKSVTKESQAFSNFIG